MLMNLTSALEAVLFAAGEEGLTADELSRILQLPMESCEELCGQLQALYEEKNGGLQVTRLAGAWQIMTRTEFSPYLQRMATAPTTSGLSNAALEVLAIVAYQQPISRFQIDEIRGVQSDRAVSTLVHRQLIREVSRMDSPGRPILYGTTDTFLRTFGLASLDDLPPMPQVSEGPTDLSLFQLTPSLPKD